MLETQALDLIVVVPLSWAAAYWLWRQSPWGYFLTAITLGFGSMMCVVIPAWIAVPLVREGTIPAVEAVPFLLISGLGLFLSTVFYRGLRDDA